MPPRRIDRHSEPLLHATTRKREEDREPRSEGWQEFGMQRKKKRKIIEKNNRRILVRGEKKPGTGKENEKAKRYLNLLTNTKAFSCKLDCEEKREK